MPSAASSAAGAAPDDDDAVDACAAGVLDRNRYAVPPPPNAAGSDATRLPVPLKGWGPEPLLRPLVGLGITTVSMGVSAGVGSERSLFAALTEGPLLLACAFAAGCAEGALLAGLSFIASSGAGGSLLFLGRPDLGGSLLRDLAFLGSDSARFFSNFAGSGAASIFGAVAFGADLPLTRRSLSAVLPVHV